MIGLKGAGGGTTGDALQHGGFDFEVAALVQEAADLSDHLGAGDEDLGRVLVTHQVEVTLAILGLAVGDPVPLVGHGAQRLAEHGELVDLDGRLTFAGGEGFTLDTDPVAQIEQLVGGPVRLADTFLVEVNLDAALDITNGGEYGFSHVPDGEHAPGDGDRLLISEVSLELARGGGGVEFATKRVDAELAQFGEFFTPDGDEFCFGGLGSGLSGVDSGVAGWSLMRRAAYGANRNNSRAEMGDVRIPVEVAERAGEMSVILLPIDC